MDVKPLFFSSQVKYEIPAEKCQGFFHFKKETASGALSFRGRRAGPLNGRCASSLRYPAQAVKLPTPPGGGVIRGGQSPRLIGWKLFLQYVIMRRSGRVAVSKGASDF